VRDHVIGIAERMPKPVVTILLGERPPTPADGNVHYAHILDEAARIAGELAGTRASRSVALQPAQQWIKGLNTGDTLAAEAAMVLREAYGVGGLVAVAASAVQQLVVNGDGVFDDALATSDEQSDGVL
jgi:FdrA protein